MIAASVGVGTGEDAYQAGLEAATMVLSGLPDKKVDALLVFGSVTFDQDKLIEGVAAGANSPETIIVGCSTAGEISSEGFSMEGSVVILGIVSDQMHAYADAGHHILWNAFQAGNDFANALEYNSHGYITSCLLFLDILSGNGEQTLSGVLNRVGTSFPVYGGAASDDLRFFETYQYLANKVYKGSIVGIGFSGDYHAVGVAMHGFLPIGIGHKVTRAESTTVFEIDGKPAMKMYEDYLGEEYSSQLREGLLPSLAVSYPLGVFLPGTRQVVLRNPVFVDQHGAMTFTAAIPQGADVRIMISGVEEGLASAKKAAEEVLLKLNGKKPKAVLIINSIARKKLLGADADEEIRMIQQILGRDVPMAGFYSYAQIGGLLGDQVPFHNGAMLIWALAE